MKGTPARDLISPAIAAVATATATTATTTEAAATAATTTTAEAAATAASTTTRAFTSHADIQGPAVQIGAVEAFDGARRLGGIAELNETETARLTGDAIRHDGCGLEGAEFFELRAQIALGRGKVEISHEKSVLH